MTTKEKADVNRALSDMIKTLIKWYSTPNLSPDAVALLGELKPLIIEASEAMGGEARRENARRNAALRRWQAEKAGLCSTETAVYGTRPQKTPPSPHTKHGYHR